jgi:hypothetical protein
MASETLGVADVSFNSAVTGTKHAEWESSNTSGREAEFSCAVPGDAASRSADVESRPSNRIRRALVSDGSWSSAPLHPAHPCLMNHRTPAKRTGRPPAPSRFERAIARVRNGGVVECEPAWARIRKLIDATGVPGKLPLRGVLASVPSTGCVHSHRSIRCQTIYRARRQWYVRWGNGVTRTGGGAIKTV